MAILPLWDCWQALVPPGSASPRPSFRARCATLLWPAGVWLLLPVAAHLSSVRTASEHGWAVWWPGQLVPLLMIATGVYASVPKPPEETADAHRRLSQQVDEARRALVAGLALFATLVALGFLSVSVQAVWYGCFVVFGALAAFPLAFGGAIQLRQASRAVQLYEKRGLDTPPALQSLVGLRLVAYEPGRRLHVRGIPGPGLWLSTLVGFVVLVIAGGSPYLMPDLADALFRRVSPETTVPLARTLEGLLVGGFWTAISGNLFILNWQELRIDQGQPVRVREGWRRRKLDPGIIRHGEVSVGMRRSRDSINYALQVLVRVAAPDDPKRGIQGGRAWLLHRDLDRATVVQLAPFFRRALDSFWPLGR